MKHWTHYRATEMYIRYKHHARIIPQFGALLDIPCCRYATRLEHMFDKLIPGVQNGTI